METKTTHEASHSHPHTSLMSLTEHGNDSQPSDLKKTLNKRLDKLFAQLDVSTSQYLDEQALVAKAMGVEQIFYFRRVYRLIDCN